MILKIRGNPAGEHWELNGVQTWETKHILKFDRYLEPPQLNLSEIVTPSRISELHFSPMAGVDSAGLHLPSAITPLNQIQWESKVFGNMWVWIGLGAAVVVLALIAVGLCYRYKQGWLQNVRHGDKTELIKNEPKSSEQKPTAPVIVQNEGPYCTIIHSESVHKSLYPRVVFDRSSDMAEITLGENCSAE